jgi:transcriptional regulator with XRE-family HTH domain
MMWAMAPPYDESALQRLATLVIQRRSSLGMNKIDVARAAQIQINTYSKVEEGKSVRPVTYGKIEPVIGWARGSCLDILRGAAGATLVEARPGGTAISPVREGDLAADVAAAVQDAAVSVSDTLTAAEIRELKRRVVEELEKRGRITGFDRD